MSISNGEATSSITCYLSGITLSFILNNSVRNGCGSASLILIEVTKSCDPTICVRENLTLTSIYSISVKMNGDRSWTSAVSIILIVPNLGYRNTYLLITSCCTSATRINPPALTSVVMSVAIKIESCSVINLSYIGWNNGLILKPTILKKRLKVSKVKLIIKTCKVKGIAIRGKSNCRKNLICRKRLNSTVNKVENKRVLKIRSRKLICGVNTSTSKL